VNWCVPVGSLGRSGRWFQSAPAHHTDPPQWRKLQTRVLVSDEVSWSDTTAFHNNLVVGSSPTKSTTQSPTTEEISCHCAHAASAVADA